MSHHKGQNIANSGELQGSGIYRSSKLLYQKGGKALVGVSNAVH